MALINMNFTSGGANLTETTLWTNPNTSAAFSAQAVQLIDSYTNYDYIRFYYKPYASGALGEETFVQYSKEEIYNKWGIQGSLSSGDALGSIVQYYNNSSSYSRLIGKYSSGNDYFYFYNAGIVNGSGTGTSVCKPTKITGLR